MRHYRHRNGCRPQGKSVTLIGGGNIGSPSATLLGRLSDVEFIRVIDPDVYEASNLSSQSISPADVGQPKALVLARRVRQQCPGVAVESIVSRVEDVPLGLLRADLLVSCLDTRIARRAVNEVAGRLQIPLLDSGVDAHALQARVNYYRPGNGRPCLECSWNDADREALEQVYPCQQGSSPSTPTRAPANLGSIAAGLLVTECQKVFAGEVDEQLNGYQVLLDCRHYRCLHTAYSVNPQCRFDHAAWRIDLLNTPPQKWTLGDLLEFAGTQQPDGPPAVRVAGQSFARRLVCPSCTSVRDECLYLTRVLTPSRLRCSSCHSQMSPSGFHIVDWLDAANVRRRHWRRSLSSIGLQAGDVVAVRMAAGCRYFEFPDAESRVASLCGNLQMQSDGGAEHE